MTHMQFAARVAKLEVTMTWPDGDVTRIEGENVLLRADAVHAGWPPWELEFPDTRAQLASIPAPEADKVTFVFTPDLPPSRLTVRYDPAPAASDG